MILLVQAVNGHGSSGGGSPVVATAAATSPSPDRSLTSMATPSTTAATPTAASPTPAAATMTPAVVTTPPPAATPITLFNLAHISRYALLARDRLRGAGYPVPIVEYRPFSAPAAVVYFDSGNTGQQAAARGLVGRHLGIDAAVPRPPSIPAAGGLIVLVPDSYR